MKLVKFSELLGQTFDRIERRSDYNDLIIFENTDHKYVMQHEQDCCESVYIQDISGELTDLVGAEILMAEESTQDMPNDEPDRDSIGMWTFYRLATAKGYVTIRWNGQSNGYYSVSVDLHEEKIIK